MLIFGLNIPTQEQYSLNSKLVEKIRELARESCMVIFLKPDYLTFNLLEQGSYAQFSNFPTILITVPKQYNDEPQEFLTRLKSNLHLEPNDPLQFAGIYTKVHQEHGEENDVEFTTIETVFLP